MATANLYGQALMKALNKEIDWDSDDIRVALVTSSYIPNQDTHSYWSDVVANEITGVNYVTNGESLSTKTITYDGILNKIHLAALDVTWPNATLTARYAIVYDRTPATDATRPLLGYVDFGSNQSSSNGNFTIQWDADGIFEITIA